MAAIYSPLSSQEKLIYLIRKIIFLMRASLFQKRFSLNTTVLSGSYYCDSGNFVSPPWSLRSKFRLPLSLILLHVYADIYILFSSYSKLKRVENELFQNIVQKTVNTFCHLNLTTVIVRLLFERDSDSLYQLS